MHRVKPINSATEVVPAGKPRFEHVNGAHFVFGLHRLGRSFHR